MARLAAVHHSDAGRSAESLAAILSASTWRERQHRRSWVVPRAGLAWWGWTTPDVAAAESVTVAVDGRVYNGASLDAASKNDAALVLALYRKHGFVDAIRQLNGDFAIVLYDEAADTLWLARDRFGVKPLYFVQTPAGFACASQPGPLLAFPGVGRDLNPQFVGLFAGGHYRYFDNDPVRSPYASVMQVPAAHVLKLREGACHQQSYWSLTDGGDNPAPEAELRDRYRELLLDAVDIRFARAARPAFTLSGGMDSSSVLASAVHLSGQKQPAFSAVYDDPTYDESAEIASMLGQCVAEWHPVRVGRPDVPALVQRMIDVHDEPVATATWLSHFLLCESMAGAGYLSVFGGLGGDELNAGEYEHFFYHFADLRRSGNLQALGHEVDCWIRHHDHPVFRKNRAVVDEAFTKLVDLDVPGRCRPDRRRLDRYACAVNPDYFDVRSFTPVMDHPFSSYLKNRTFQDLARETIPCCLRAEDRHADAFGLEPRLPFFDHRLVEFMFRIPGTLKIRDGVSKVLLRDAMRGILPEPTRTRIKKTGWNAPAHVWFSGERCEVLLDLVRSQDFRERGVYDVKEVERLIDEHQAIVTSGRPQENHMMFLWQLINLEVWFQSRTSEYQSACPVALHESASDRVPFDTTKIP